MRLRHVLAAIALGGLTSLAACSSESSAGGTNVLTIWWFQWDPATGLGELGREFEAETGIAVNVRQVPLSSYQDQVFLEFGNDPTAFDIVIGDSQWIGRGASKGLYEELTEWLPSS